MSHSTYDYVGKGIPGWDPYYGKDVEKMDPIAYIRLGEKELSAKIHLGETIKPTGILNDPRLPAPGPPKVSIVSLLSDAVTRMNQEIAAEHAQMVAAWRARKSGTWAQRASTAAAPAPTLQDARKRRAKRLAPPPWPKDRSRSHYYSGGSCCHWGPPPPMKGVWHEWEIVELETETQRQRRALEAEMRADAEFQRFYPNWGGGT